MLSDLRVLLGKLRPVLQARRLKKGRRRDRHLIADTDGISTLAFSRTLLLT